MAEPFPTQLRRTYFRRWLLQHDGREIIGRRGNPEQCPIATWLNETYGVPALGQRNFSVDGNDITGDTSGAFIRRYTPDWAIAFIRCVDIGASYLGHEVDAETALQVLNEEVPLYE